MSAKSRRKIAAAPVSGSKAKQPVPKKDPTKQADKTKRAQETIPAAIRSNRRMDIELLRVVAVLSVMMFHFAPGFNLVPHGYLGVDIFFTISGFVITAQILRARDKGTFTYASFLAGRVRRLLPSAVLVIFVTMVVIVIFGNPITARSESRAASAALLYVANFFYAHRAVDYFAQGQDSSFIHFWSLSVEEQFYIFWPLALLLIAFVTRHSVKRFLRVAGLVAAVVGVFSLVGASIAMQHNPASAFFLPWWRAHQLLIGALVAIVLHARKPSVGGVNLSVRRCVSVVRIACVLWLVVLVVQNSFNVPSPGWQSIYASLPVAFILATGWVSERDVLVTVGRFRPLAWIAATSYVIYLWHWPVWIFLTQRMPSGTRGGVLIAIAVIVSLALAAATHYFIEVPIRVGKVAHDLSKSRVIAAGLGSAVVLSVLFATVAPVLALSRTGAYASTLTPPIASASHDGAPDFVANCFQGYAEPASFATCTDNPAGQRKTLLIGDSHAMQWQGVMAEVAPGLDTVLTTGTRADCPVWDVLSPYGGAQQAAQCNKWRQDMYQYVADQKPDVVVLSTYSATPLLDPSTLHPPTTQAREMQLFDQGVISTIDTIRATGAKVVVLEDTPGAPWDPIACLSTATDEHSCTFPNADDSAMRNALREVVKTIPGVSLVNPYPVVCPATTCLVVSGNIIQYYDNLHLTNTFALTLGPWVKTWWANALSASTS